MAGAATVATTGSAMAIASNRTRAARLTTMCGEDSSTTGSRVSAGIDHSETINAPAATAASAPTSNGAQNATTTSRRAPQSGGAGHSVSAMVEKLGRAMIRTSAAGTAM